MSKILKNQTVSDVAIADTGVTVPASGQYTIPPEDYDAFAASSDVISLLADGSLILNDGSNDITIVSDAVDVIKGWFPSTTASFFLAEGSPPADGLTTFAFKDQFGNLILPQLNSSNEILVNSTVNNFPSIFDVNITNSTLAVTQSTSPWIIDGTVSATQSGVWTTARSWSLSSGTDSVNVGNFPATQAVTQSTSPWIVSGTVAATQSGSWSTGRTWNLSFGSDAVTSFQGGTWTVQQGSAPWTFDLTRVGGTSVTLGQKLMASSLPVTLPSDQSALPVSQSGSWTVTANAGTNLNTSALALETTQSAQNTLIGAVTESAPATDTASSGLNGRLQRIAQRITSLIALIPTSLGQKTMANSFAVVLASDQSSIPVSASIASISSSTASLSNVSASATNVTLLSSNSSRKGFKLYNDSNKTAYVKFGATASTTSFTFKMAADSYYEDVSPFYTGQIDALWDAASGTMRVSELT